VEKFFKIVGIVVVAWIVLSLIGWLIWGVIKFVFWVAIIVGPAYVVFTLVTKGRNKSIGRR
jgi:hypothetical protein